MAKFVPWHAVFARNDASGMIGYGFFGSRLHACDRFLLFFLFSSLRSTIPPLHAFAFFLSSCSHFRYRGEGRGEDLHGRWGSRSTLALYSFHMSVGPSVAQHVAYGSQRHHALFFAAMGGLEVCESFVCDTDRGSLFGPSSPFNGDGAWDGLSAELFFPFLSRWTGTESKVALGLGSFALLCFGSLGAAYSVCLLACLHTWRSFLAFALPPFLLLLAERRSYPTSFLSSFFLHHKEIELRVVSSCTMMYF